MRQRREKKNNSKIRMIAAILSAVLILTLFGDGQFVMAASKVTSFIGLDDLNDWTSGSDTGEEDDSWEDDDSDECDDSLDYDLEDSDDSYDNNEGSWDESDDRYDGDGENEGDADTLEGDRSSPGIGGDDNSDVAGENESGSGKMGDSGREEDRDPDDSVNDQSGEDNEHSWNGHSGNAGTGQTDGDEKPNAGGNGTQAGGGGDESGKTTDGSLPGGTNGTKPGADENPQGGKTDGETDGSNSDTEKDANLMPAGKAAKLTGKAAKPTGKAVNPLEVNSKKGAGKKTSKITVPPPNKSLELPKAGTSKGANSAKVTAVPSATAVPGPTGTGINVSVRRADTYYGGVGPARTPGYSSSYSSYSTNGQMRRVEKEVSVYATVKMNVRTTTERVNGLLKVRTGKGREYPVAGTIQKGGVFFLIKGRRREEWSYIEAEDSAHHVLRGYVKTDFITETGAKARLKKYGDRYRSFVAVMRTEKDNEAFAAVKRTVYEEVAKSHTRIKYEWVSDALNTFQAGTIRMRLVEFAVQYLGRPYVWGGESLTEGCDCSGFTMQVYRHFGIELPRCSYEQAEFDTRIDKFDAKPGDLLFYARDGQVYHVLIYIGGGQAVNASSSTTGIIISNVKYDETCWGVRVIDDEVAADTPL